MRIKIDAVGDIRQTPIGDLKIIDSEFIDYHNGKFFIRYLYEDLLDRLVEDLHNNAAQDYDNMIVIQGGEGSGKSHLAYNLCRKYDNSFDVKECYTYDMDALKERFKKKDYGTGVFWLDEMSNVANNRDWQSQSNKDIVGILETMRSKHFLFCGCIPHVERLDIYIREFRMRYQITCQPMKFEINGRKERGYFELKKRNKNGKMELIGYGIYPKMTEEIRPIYEDLKLKFQQSKIDELIGNDEKPGAKYKKMYESECRRNREIMLRMYESGTDREHLMDLFGIENNQTFYNLINRARRSENEENQD